MTLQDKIAALPEWPERQSWPTAEERCDAALARLALAREWIEDAHQGTCEFQQSVHKWPLGEIRYCTCGRDALLKVLETP